MSDREVFWLYDPSQLFRLGGDDNDRSHRFNFASRLVLLVSVAGAIVYKDSTLLLWGAAVLLLLSLFFFSSSSSENLRQQGRSPAAPSATAIPTSSPPPPPPPPPPARLAMTSSRGMRMPPSIDPAMYTERAPVPHDMYASHHQVHAQPHHRYPPPPSTPPPPPPPPAQAAIPRPQPPQPPLWWRHDARGGQVRAPTYSETAAATRNMFTQSNPYGNSMPFSGSYPSPTNGQDVQRALANSAQHGWPAHPPGPVFPGTSYPASMLRGTDTVDPGYHFYTLPDPNGFARVHFGDINQPRPAIDKVEGFPGTVMGRPDGSFVPWRG